MRFKNKSNFIKLLKRINMKILININKIVLVGLLLVSVSFADDTNTVKELFENTFENTIKILNDQTISKEQKHSNIIKSSEQMFDFELMAKLSMGKNWRKLNETQQNEFVKLYKKKMQSSYSTKIDNFTDSNMNVKFTKQLKPNKVVIYSSIVDNAKNSFDVDFKFYKPDIDKKGKNSWLVYDVIIKGVSIIKSDRAQFGAILNRGAVDNLMDKMREQ